MKYRNFGRMDWQPSALGFGGMRFPVIDGNNSRIDEKPAAEMLYYAIDHGVNYIDTAYPYHGGTSESFIGRTLEGPYREKVKLATKYPSWLTEKEEDFDTYLNEQLSNLRTDQIDFYLLHALNTDYWKKNTELGILEWVLKAKQDGRIGKIGFSFHDEYSVFKTIVDSFELWDFCLIQYNYMDQNYQAGHEGLKYAAKNGMGVVIMEPLRGGRMIDPPDAIQEIWDESEIKRSPAEWSLQWLWNQPEVSLVLSGMSTLEHVKENVASADRSGIGTLTENDLERVEKVRLTYEGFQLVPCTNCGYCLPCPDGVNIPRILKIYNDGTMYDKEEKASNDYNLYVPETEKADRCVECGECIEKCPQDIAIPDWMERIHREYTD